MWGGGVGVWGGWGCWGHFLCDAMQHLLLVLTKIRCTRLTVHKPKSRYHALGIIAELLNRRTYREGWG